VPSTGKETSGSVDKLSFHYSVSNDEPGELDGVTSDGEGNESLQGIKIMSDHSPGMTNNNLNCTSESNMFSPAPFRASPRILQLKAAKEARVNEAPEIVGKRRAPSPYSKHAGIPPRPQKKSNKNIA
jgi:hypothetical protein